MTRQTLIRYKVFFDRSKVYVGSIQFLLIGAVFLRPFEDTSWGKVIVDYAIVTVPLGLMAFLSLCLLVGWLDSKLGIRSAEFRDLANSNPVFMETLERVKRIEEKMEKK